MAETSIASTNNLRKVAWDEKLFRSQLPLLFFGPMMGEATKTLHKGFRMYSGTKELSSPNDIIHVKMQLSKSPTVNAGPGKGDEIRYGLVPYIDANTYPGVTGDQDIVGKEVPITDYDDSLTLAAYRQGFSLGTPMDWQRASYDVPGEVKIAAQNWGVMKTDCLIRDAYDTMTSTQIFYLDGTSGVPTRTTTEATAKAAIETANSKITPAFVSWLKAWALTGGDGTMIPMRPINIAGDEFYILLVHHFDTYDWGQNSTWQQALREAEKRGPDHPLFKKAKAIWDDVLIMEYGNITRGTNAGAGSNVYYTKGHLLGAQSMLWGWGAKPWSDSETRNGGWNHYLYWNMIAKAKKPIFNSQVFGSVCVYLAHSAISA